ncbi:unnamed protein product, partial [Prorocentrum cordatum]
ELPPLVLAWEQEGGRECRPHLRGPLWLRRWALRHGRSCWKAVPGNWRVAQEWRGYHYGDVITPPAGFAGLGVPARGVVPLADGSAIFVEWVTLEDEGSFADRAVAPDCRLLPVRVYRTGRPFRSLENIVESCRQESLPDFIAPRTALWCLEHLAGEGRSLEAHFEHFKKLCGLQDSRWGMEEYANVVSYLKALLHHDQVDASDILSVEMMFRRLQTIEYCYSDKLRERSTGSSGGRLTADEQAAFGATARAETRLIVPPALLESAEQELERGASLAKSLLKAREARESLGKKRPGQQGQGSGGEDVGTTGDARSPSRPPGNFDRNVGRDLLPFPTEPPPRQSHMHPGSREGAGKEPGVGGVAMLTFFGAC